MGGSTFDALDPAGVEADVCMVHADETSTRDDRGIDRIDRARFPKLARHFRLGNRLTLAERRSLRERLDLERPEPTPRVEPSTPHYELEWRTEVFRARLAWAHIARAREARSRARTVLDDAWEDRFERRAGERSDVVQHWVINSKGEESAQGVGLFNLPVWAPKSVAELRAAATTKLWHERRARGQVHRFGRVRTCGERCIIATCKACGDDRKPIAETCGVRRVCDRCDVDGAVQRRTRFGRARGRAILDAHERGLTRKIRSGGRYSEKMLTLTLPHATMDQSWGAVRKEARDTVHARILALWKAWPKFLRYLNRWWSKQVGCIGAVYHRAFEWTPAKDGHGHPHFHVYLYCPFVHKDLIREWWAVALLSVGWPVQKNQTTGASVLRTDVRELKGPNCHMVEELLKGGRRSALTLSRIQFDDSRRGFNPHNAGLIRTRAGLDAFDYAEGWTMGDVEGLVSEECRASLYKALEGRRLSQASRGFFVDDEPSSCECGCPHFRVRFEVPPRGILLPAPHTPHTTVHERAPP